jgi:signal transduction histidine kinase
VNIEKMKKYLESLNELLEKKVLIRTTDLNNSLSKLKELKNKEDKLYYILGMNLQSSVTEIKDISSLLMKLDSIDNEERMSLVNIIHKRGEELFISLEDLIAWSKIQSGILLAQFEKISLKELTSHSIGILKESAIRKKIKLSFDISDELIFTDKRLLGFILRKIFSNAILVFFGKISYCFYSFQALVLFAIGSNHNEIIKFFPVPVGKEIIILFIELLIKFIASC